MQLIVNLYGTTFFSFFVQQENIFRFSLPASGTF